MNQEFLKNLVDYEGFLTASGTTDTPSLNGKNIIIAITASISAYKVLDLISMLKKLGANVYVILSQEAKKFITPLSIEALTHTVVLHSETEKWGDNENEFANLPNHISYANKADVMLLAPATINSIAKLANGIADNLIVESILACKAPILIAPSANTNMMHSAQNKQNLEKLKNLGYEIIPPRVSRLACDTTGDGALALCSDLLFSLYRALSAKVVLPSLAILGGGSEVEIDSVRVLNNRSSGKFASNLALAGFFMIDDLNISLIASKCPFALPSVIKDHSARGNRDFSTTALGLNSEIYICAAALSDFGFNRIEGKIKKQDVGEVLNLEFHKMADILPQLPNFKVGFKAESDSQNALKNAYKMLENKSCNLVVLNIISDENRAFGTDDNSIYLIDKSSDLEIISPIYGHKLYLSIKILERISKIYESQNL